MEISRLNEKQIAKFEAIMEETKKLRKKITLYRKDDPGYALFRINAFNRITDAVILKVLNRPWTKKITDWLVWQSDDSELSQNVQALFKAIKEFKRR